MVGCAVSVGLLVGRGVSLGVGVLSGVDVPVGTLVAAEVGVLLACIGAGEPATTVGEITAEGTGFTGVGVTGPQETRVSTAARQSKAAIDNRMVFIMGEAARNLLTRSSRCRRLTNGRGTIIGPVTHLLVEEHHREAALYGVDAPAIGALNRVAQHLHVTTARRAGEDTFQVYLMGGRTLLAAHLRNQVVPGLRQELVDERHGAPLERCQG